MKHPKLSFLFIPFALHTIGNAAGSSVLASAATEVRTETESPLSRALEAPSSPPFTATEPTSFVDSMVTTYSSSSEIIQSQAPIVQVYQTGFQGGLSQAQLSEGDALEALRREAFFEGHFATLTMIAQMTGIPYQRESPNTFSQRIAQMITDEHARGFSEGQASIMSVVGNITGSHWIPGEAATDFLEKTQFTMEAQYNQGFADGQSLLWKTSHTAAAPKKKTRRGGKNRHNKWTKRLALASASAATTSTAAAKGSDQVRKEEAKSS